MTIVTAASSGVGKLDARAAVLSKMKRCAALLLALALLVTARGLVEAVGHDYRGDMAGISPTAEAHLRAIRRHLEDPFHGYTKVDVLASSFAIVALSNLACGLLNVVTMAPERRPELAPLAAELVRRGLAVSPYASSPEHLTALDDHNLYWSHLALVLGAYRQITGDARYDRFHERVVRHLVARTVADGDFHASSYPGSSKWPADQTATLAAITLYDRAHGAALAPPLVAGWLRVMRAHTDARTGLFASSISSISHAKIPRGCALSWSTYYLAQLAPEVAAQQYDAYRRAYAHDVLGIGGFREWPADRSHAMDIDSGPIVLGVGMAATGFGLGAARVSGDVRTYATIGRTAALFGVPVQLRARSSLLAPLLGEAILFNGETAVHWSGGDVAPSGRAPFSLGAWLCFSLWLALFVRTAAVATTVRRACPTP